MQHNNNISPTQNTTNTNYTTQINKQSISQNKDNKQHIKNPINTHKHNTINHTNEQQQHTTKHTMQQHTQHTHTTTFTQNNTYDIIF